MAKKDDSKTSAATAAAGATTATTASDAAGATAPKAAKQETQYKTVTMDDGKVVDFAGKRKMLKTSTIDEGTGEVSVRLDFVNGEVRHFKIPSSLRNKCAAHGAEQKLGDEIAGLEDVEDCILAIDELLPRLEAEKTKKVSTVDTGALLSQLTGEAAATVAA